MDVFNPRHRLDRRRILISNPLALSHSEFRILSLQDYTWLETTTPGDAHCFYFLRVSLRRFRLETKQSEEISGRINAFLNNNKKVLASYTPQQLMAVIS